MFPRSCECGDALLYDVDVTISNPKRNYDFFFAVFIVPTCWEKYGPI